MKWDKLVNLITEDHDHYGATPEQAVEAELFSKSFKKTSTMLSMLILGKKLPVIALGMDTKHQYIKPYEEITKDDVFAIVDNSESDGENIRFMVPEELDTDKMDDGTAAHFYYSEADGLQYLDELEDRIEKVLKDNKWQSKPSGLN